MRKKKIINLLKLKSQIVIKIKNWICDKSQFVRKLKKIKFDKISKTKIVKKKIVAKLKN